MSESYEEIVRKYYDRMRPRFIGYLMSRYKTSKMQPEDAENIYQDIFLAIRDNLLEGRIAENTSWSSYIMTVGLNMASKQYRMVGKTDSSDETPEDEKRRQSEVARKVEEIIQTLKDQEERDLYTDPEAHALLGDELAHTPEPCASIIRLTYYSGLSDAEITEELDRYNSAKAVKAKRWQCMQDLIFRVKKALYFAGITDVKPIKKQQDGKN